MRMQLGPRMTDEEIDKALASIDDSKLGDEWNQDFMKSVRGWWKKTRKLSDRQRTRLKEIWDKQNEKSR